MPTTSRYLNVLIHTRLMLMRTIALKGEFNHDAISVLICIISLCFSYRALPLPVHNVVHSSKIVCMEVKILSLWLTRHFPYFNLIGFSLYSHMLILDDGVTDLILKGMKRHRWTSLQQIIWISQLLSYPPHMNKTKLKEVSNIKCMLDNCCLFFD
jgi:hypothetical protein